MINNCDIFLGSFLDVVGRQSKDCTKEKSPGNLSNLNSMGNQSWSCELLSVELKDLSSSGQFNRNCCIGKESTLLFNSTSSIFGNFFIKQQASY